MTSAIEAFLMGSSNAVATEDLKSMAVEAARGYITKQASLSGTIAQLADARSLNDHQVERVAQTANHLVFRHKFASGEKVVEFPIAKPSEIQTLRGRNKTAAYKREVSIPVGTYIPGAGALDSYREKTAAAAPKRVSDRVQPPSFFTKDIEKVASDLACAVTYLEGDVYSTKSRVRRATEELVKQAHYLAAQGTSVYDMVDALSQVAALSVVLRGATDTLVQEMARYPQAFREHDRVKEARQADTSHPFTKAYSALEHAVVDLETVCRASKEMQEHAKIARHAQRAAADIYGDIEKQADFKSTMTNVGKKLGLLEDITRETKKKVTHYTHDDAVQAAKDYLKAKKLKGGVNAKNVDPDDIDQIGKATNQVKAVRGPMDSEVIISTPDTQVTRLGRAAQYAGIAGVIGGGVHLGTSIYDKAKNKATFNSNLKAAIKLNPDLKRLSPETLTGHFGVLQKFAPDMASEPVAAGSFLRQSAQRGDIGIDPMTIKTLADLQKAHGEGESSKGRFTGAMRTLTGLQGIGG